MDGQGRWGEEEAGDASRAEPRLLVWTFLGCALGGDKKSGNSFLSASAQAHTGLWHPPAPAQLAAEESVSERAAGPFYSP